jgi:hypothetical protein
MPADVGIDPEDPVAITGWTLNYGFPKETAMVSAEPHTSLCVIKDLTL